MQGRTITEKVSGIIPRIVESVFFAETFFYYTQQYFFCFCLVCQSGLWFVAFADGRNQEQQDSCDENKHAADKEPAFWAVVGGKDALNAKSQRSEEIADTAGQRKNTAKVDAFVVSL